MNSTASFERELLLPEFVIPGAAPETGETSEPPLRPVPKRVSRPARRISPLTGAMIAVGLVLGIFALQLGLSIAVSEGAYASRALELEQRDLVRVERVLEQNVDKLSSPQNLAENAMKLGMVQNAQPAVLRLSDHVIMGELASRTTAVSANLIPNSTLAALPIVNAEGLRVDRNAGQAGAAPAAAADTPVPWQGKLPAPDTH